MSESTSSKSSPPRARADPRARARLDEGGVDFPSAGEGGLARLLTLGRVALRSWLMDSRLITRGGGGLLGLIAFAVAGWFLPGLVRLGILVVLALVVKWLWPRADAPGTVVLMPVLGGAVAWLVLVWGFGLLNPFVTLGLVALTAFGVVQWIRLQLYLLSGLLALVEALRVPMTYVPPPAPEPTADERLDALLEEAPVAGLESKVIEDAMAPYMGRSTLYKRLPARGMQISRGRWRAPIKPISR